MQCLGARTATDSMLNAAIGGKLLLESLDLGAENEVCALDHAAHGFVDFRPNGAVLRLKIDQRNSCNGWLHLADRVDGL